VTPNRSLEPTGKKEEVRSKKPETVGSGRADMCVAALYDIHGNLPALEAVLQDIRQADVGQIV